MGMHIVLSIGVLCFKNLNIIIFKNLCFERNQRKKSMQICAGFSFVCLNCILINQICNKKKRHKNAEFNKCIKPMGTMNAARYATCYESVTFFLGSNCLLKKHGN